MGMVFHPRFRRDVAAASRTYGQQQEGLGDAFREEVARALELIRMFPLSGQLVEGNLRRQLVKRFPYHILYQVAGDSVYVVAVAHQRRRPGHWQRRLS
jgi:plasmid stabilization system protein ParE